MRDGAIENSCSADERQSAGKASLYDKFQGANKAYSRHKIYDLVANDYFDQIHGIEAMAPLQDFDRLVSGEKHQNNATDERH